MFTISWRQEKPCGIGLGRHTHTNTQFTHTCRPAWLSGNCMRGFGALNSSPPEYLLLSQWVPVLAPTYLLPRRSEWCSHQSMTQNLSDMSRYFETGEAQFRSVTEIAPKSPFLCVNRRPTRYDSRGDAKAIQFGVN